MQAEQQPQNTEETAEHPAEEEDEVEVSEQ